MIVLVLLVPIAVTTWPIQEFITMLQSIPQIEQFKQQLRAVLSQEVAHCRTVTVAKQAHVYTCGDQDGAVYLIESGQIKLLMLTPDGSVSKTRAASVLNHALPMKNWPPWSARRAHVSAPLCSVFANWD